MNQGQQSRWQPTRRQVLWTVGIVVVLAALVVLIRSGIRSGIVLAVLALVLASVLAFVGGFRGYLTRLEDRLGDRATQAAWWTVGIVVALVVLISIGYDLQWTGFGQSKVAQDVRPEKTLWDWLDLLVVPVVLAIGGYLFTRSETRATQAAAERRAQDDALQAYLDHMSAMLIPNKDQPSLYKAYKGDSLSSVARARTLTVLPRVNPDHKARVVQFLYESGLIAKGRPILDLAGADLSEANLRGARLMQADLIEAYLIEADLGYADLSGADLSEADLSRAYLQWAYLIGADLSRAYLNGADLSRADLSRAYLSGAYLSEAALRHADLSEADLSGTDLSGADLIEADLSGADLRVARLSYADLRGARLSGATGWTVEQLAAAKFLTGATMPDGRVLKGPENPNGPTFTEWLKSRDRGEAAEDSAS